MSKDVILYEKQKQKFSKALGKAQDALSDLFVVANEIGVTPVGRPEAASAASTDAEPKAKAKRGTKEKKEKTEVKKTTRANGSAFAEM